MQNPIFAAIIEGDMDRVLQLAVDPANLEARTDLGEEYPSEGALTPLMLAACVPGERAGIVEALLNAGADIRTRSNAGVSAVYYAAGAGV